MGDFMQLRPACRAWIACVVAGVASSAVAQPQLCLRDADSDGFPISSQTEARTDYEYHSGRWFSATPTSVAFADFHRDGKLDAVVANARLFGSSSREYYLTVLRGHGDGVFDPLPPVYAAGQEATDVAAADLNGDGWPDAATADATGNTVSVHLNAGNGTLLPRVEYPAGQQPRCIRIADLDGDTRPDLVALNCESSDVSIFRNLGGAVFAAQVRVPAPGVSPRGDPNLNFAYPGPFFEIGDLDGNGSPDMAVPAGGAVRLLLNNGQGGFSLSPMQLSVPGPYQTYAVVIADFDRDGRQDIAVSLVTFAVLPRVAVFRNLGGGVFSPAALYDASSCPSCTDYLPSLSVGDLDGDGFPDLAAAHENGRAVSLFRNQRDGTFVPQEPLQTYRRPWYVRLTDLNGDGRADLAALTGLQRGHLRVVLTDGAGQLSNYEMFAPGVSESRQSVAVADLDGDGDPDLVEGIAPPPPPNLQSLVRVIRNDGGDLLDYPPIAATPAARARGQAVAVGDLDGDQRTDIVVADLGNVSTTTLPGSIWVISNLGDMNFGPPVRYPLVDVLPYGVATGDLTGDQRPDVAVWSVQTNQGAGVPAERRVLTMLNNGDGTLSPGQSVTIDTAIWGSLGDIAIADVDRDGLLDVVATSGTPLGAPGKVAVLRNMGGGTLAPPEMYEIAPGSLGVRVLDLSRDGAPDIAVSHGVTTDPPYAGVYLTVLFNNSAGQFPARHEFADPNFEAVGGIGVNPEALPGQPRIVLPGNDGQIRVMTEGADGRFLPDTLLGGPSDFGNGVAIVDLDGDGRPDILQAGNGPYTAVFRNRGCRIPCYANCDGSTSPPILNVSDFICFLNRFAAGDPYANCDGSTTLPSLNVSDFICFINIYGTGCP